MSTVPKNVLGSGYIAYSKTHTHTCTRGVETNSSKYLFAFCYDFFAVLPFLTAKAEPNCDCAKEITLD